MTKQPTCTDKGSRTGYCTTCKQTIEEEIDALGHSYKWTLEQTGDGSFTLTGVCNVCGDEKITENITDVKEETLKEATCSQSGSVRYTYVNESGETVELIAETAKIPHTLNGKAATEFADEHGRYNADTNGITEFADDRASCSGKHGKGYYTCEECGELVYVETYKEHTYKDYTVTKPATCTEDGEKTFTCEVCGAKATAKIEKLGHHYGVKITKFPTADAVGEAVITCDREGCNETHTVELPALNGEGAYKVTVIEKASCSKEGVNRYEFKDETTGETIAFETVTSMTAHTQGEHAKIYVWTADGVQYHGYVCEECGQMIVLESNPIEESAN